MRTITIPAKYKGKQIIPLAPLPEEDNYEAIIVLMKLEDHKNYNKLLTIRPISLGKELKPITRKKIYENFR